MKIVDGLSPMMRHYLKMKEQYPDCFLFYRLGDFYEMFFEDAIEGSKLMELTLTGRDCGLQERAPMCGVPYHSVDTYVQRLISKGKKVAICEQMEDPATAKGLVDRAVIRVITPGTVIEEKLLDAGKNNFLLSIYMGKTGYGYAYADVSTGEFMAGEITPLEADDQLVNEIVRIGPTECIANEAVFGQAYIKKKLQSLCYLEKQPDSIFTPGRGEEVLKKHFAVAALDGFGCAGKPLVISAAGALLQYLQDTQKNGLTHIQKLGMVVPTDYMQIDANTRRNLELVSGIRTGTEGKNTLVYLLNKTKTSMGQRMLKSWIDCPLQNIADIEARQQAVQELFDSPRLRTRLQEHLDNIYDIHRLCSKIAYGTINPRDCIALSRSLRQIAPIKALLGDCSSPELMRIAEALDPMEDTATAIDQAIADDPAPNLKEGGVIRTGFNQEVDELRDISGGAKKWLDDVLTRERENTGIKNLRIGFNKVFGYYLEVTKSYVDQVPFYYQRKQTLTGAERYITPELKEIENNILTANDRLIRLEAELYTKLRESLLCETPRLEQNAALLAQLDVLASFAQVAMTNRYVCPKMTDDGVICIQNGRHPIVEGSLKDGFIPNDVLLDRKDNRLLIITGPNMAGKSTYMRMTALITIMAHIGCFVPADEASICLVDRIFTRIGASDDLSAGQSTFMVEMSEVANILNNATKNSLLILDEIGRGTSTYDGLSIAWAVLEDIADPAACGAKALFATHYHQLSELEGHLSGVKNYRISVKEIGEDILFLHKIVRGSADKSFGVQVARLAGIPQNVIARAGEILQDLEAGRQVIRDDSSSVDNVDNMDNSKNAGDNSVDKAVLEDIKGLDLENLTPMMALQKLYSYHDAWRDLKHAD